MLYLHASCGGIDTDVIALWFCLHHSCVCFGLSTAGGAHRQAVRWTGQTETNDAAARGEDPAFKGSSHWSLRVHKMTAAACAHSKREDWCWAFGPFFISLEAVSYTSTWTHTRMGLKINQLPADEWDPCHFFIFFFKYDVNCLSVDWPCPRNMSQLRAVFFFFPNCP